MIDILWIQTKSYMLNVVNIKVINYYHYKSITIYILDTSLISIIKYQTHIRIELNIST